MLPLLASFGFAEQNEIFKEKYPPHGFLAAMEDQKLFLAQKSALLLKIDLKNDRNIIAVANTNIMCY